MLCICEFLQLEDGLVPSVRTRCVCIVVFFLVAKKRNSICHPLFLPSGWWACWHHTPIGRIREMRTWPDGPS